MKTTLSKPFSFFIFISAILICSCKNQITDFKSNEKAIVTFGISRPAQRVIYPDYNLQVETFEKFVLSYRIKNGDKENFEDIEKTSINELNNITLELNEGNYIFKLTAIKGGNTFEGATETEILNGQRNHVSFSLKQIEKDYEKAGTLNVKFNYKNNSNEATLKCFISIEKLFNDFTPVTYEETEIYGEYPARYLSHSFEDLTEGYYLVTAKFCLADYINNKFEDNIIEETFPGISIIDSISEVFYICGDFITDYNSDIKTINDVYKINYNGELGGAHNFKSYSAYNAKYITSDVIEEPSQDGKIFTGWYLDETFETPFENLLNSKGDITLYAKWEENIPEPETVKAAYKMESEDDFFMYMKFNSEHVFDAVYNSDSKNTNTLELILAENIPYFKNTPIPSESWTQECTVSFYQTTLENELEGFVFALQENPENDPISDDDNPGIITCMGKWGFLFSSGDNGTVIFTDYGKQLYDLGIRKFKNEIWNSKGISLTNNQIEGYIRGKPGYSGDLIPKEINYSEISQEELKNLSPATDYIIYFSSFETLEGFVFPKDIIDSAEHHISFDFTDNTNTFTEIPSNMDGAGNENGIFQGYYCLNNLKMNSNVTKIGNFAFYNSRLQTIELSEKITEIGKSAFYGTSLKSINLPTGITSIGEFAFAQTQLNEIFIPDTVTSIGTRSFYYSGLTSISLPSSVTTLGDEVFASCMSLQSVTIEGKLEECGKELFAFDHGLTEITIYSDEAFSFGENIFNYISTKPVIYVREGLLRRFEELNPDLVFQGVTFI